MTRTLIQTVLVALSLVVSTAVFAGDVEDGDAAVERKDYATALSKYKSAAARGDEDARFKLGIMYYHGTGVVQDYAEAMRLYRLAAAQGHAMAQYAVGVMYDYGRGFTLNYAEAVRWYKLAAAQGNASAQLNLGTMYYNGHGVVQDYVRAHMWMNLAAVKGDATNAVKSRDIIAARMSTQQIAEAQKMARDCQARNFKGCD